MSQKFKSILVFFFIFFLIMGLLYKFFHSEDPNYNLHVSSAFVENLHRYDTIQPELWFDSKYKQGNTISLSSMNHIPAGKFGFVESRGRSLYLGKKKIRFFGVQVPENDIRLGSEEISRYSRHLREAGFNLAKLQLIENANQIDLWIQSLKKEGIYTMLEVKIESKPEDENPEEKAVQTSRNSLRVLDNFFNLKIPNSKLKYTREPALSFLSISFTGKQPFSQTLIPAIQRKIRNLGYRGMLSVHFATGLESQVNSGSLKNFFHCTKAKPGPGSLDVNPLKKSNFLHKLIADQGKLESPMMVCSWEMPYLAQDRFLIPFYLSSFASLQDWSALIFKISSLEKTREKYSSLSLIEKDPIIRHSLRSSSILFRKKQVSASKKSYCLEISEKNEELDNSLSLRTLSEKSRLNFCSSSVSKQNSNVFRIRDLNLNFTGSDPFILSDTGEIYRNWKEGYLSVNTPYLQLFEGWLKNKILKLNHISLESKTSRALILVQSLDNHRIKESSKILILSLARSALEEENEILSEPVQAELKLEAREGLKLLDANGKEILESSKFLKYEEGRYRISIKRTQKKHFLILGKP
ncbi:MAG: hypothetical protein H7A25_15260 [Leptospiraceae bacterium]|nr:hypothetical protein [Leptospiraceae bacterium]MCP5501257.1 hypothetical protein [Leptospiraceae bacterium]